MFAYAKSQNSLKDVLAMCGLFLNLSDQWDAFPLSFCHFVIFYYSKVSNFRSCFKYSVCRDDLLNAILLFHTGIVQSRRNTTASQIGWKINCKRYNIYWPKDKWERCCINRYVYDLSELICQETGLLCLSKFSLVNIKIAVMSALHYKLWVNSVLQGLGRQKEII